MMEVLDDTTLKFAASAFFFSVSSVISVANPFRASAGIEIKEGKSPAGAGI